MTAVHPHFYIVAHTQRGCRTLKFIYHMLQQKPILVSMCSAT